MKFIETVNPKLCPCCGRPPECPCFQKLREMRRTCLHDYYQAILHDDKTTADSLSRPGSLEPSKQLTKTTIPIKSDRNINLMSMLEVNKFTCPKCLQLIKRGQEPGSDKTDGFEICEHCRLKLQMPKLGQEKVEKQKDVTRRVSMRPQKDQLKRRSSSEIDLQLVRAGLGKRLKTKLMFRSELDLLQKDNDIERSVGFKKSHELVELYQSPSFLPISNVTLSETKDFRDDVSSASTKLITHHISKEAKVICCEKPLSEPTLLTLGREEKLTEYQKLMQSKVKRITGYDLEKGMVYYFPKVSKIELKRHVSTSELIRDARQKHGSKFDDEARKLEEMERNRLEELARVREAEERRRRAREKWEKAQAKKKTDDRLKPSKDMESNELKESKDSKEPKESKEPKGPKEVKESKEPKESKGLKEHKEPKESLLIKGSKEQKSKRKSEVKGLDMSKIAPPKMTEPNIGDLLKKNQTPLTRTKDDLDKDKELADLLNKLKEDHAKQITSTVSPEREPPIKPRKAKKSHRNKRYDKLYTTDSTIETAEGHPPEVEEIIIGENVIKYKPPSYPIDPYLQGEEGEVPPMFFKTKHSGGKVDVVTEVGGNVKEDSEDKKIKEGNEGITLYALSDRSFIEKGWTVLPVEKVVRKMNVYRMRPSKPEFDWFEHNKRKVLTTYDSGEKLAEFDDNGRGRWYYKNGRLALDYYDAEETNAQQRFVVYSNGEPDERGRSRPVTVLATFDYSGNGVVFDHSGKIRLKYNQTDGVVLDREIGPVSHWKWHTLNDPPVLQQVMIDTQMPHKDPQIWKMGGAEDFRNRPDNEEMLAIEFDNFIKEKNKKMSQSFKPFQIKMKALKINENFSLKVLDQATIYLIFRDGTTNMKQNIGMVLDPQEIVDTDTTELGVVATGMDRLPARTQSIAALQRSVAYAQRFEKAKTERERRLRPRVSCASVDRLTAAISRPLCPPLRTVPTPQFAGNVTSCKCSRKPSQNNVYYNSQLM